MNASKKIDCLIAEYEMLQNNIMRRDSANLTSSSILLPSTLIILAITIEFRVSLDSFLPFVRASGVLPLFSGLLILSVYINNYRSKRMTAICYKRMDEIETLLGIKGNKFIYATVRNTWYYKIRIYLSDFLFLLSFSFSIVVSVLMFIG